MESENEKLQKIQFTVVKVGEGEENTASDKVKGLSIF